MAYSGGTSGSSVANNGAIVPKGYTQFVDGNGNVLSAGSVLFYVAGTTTPGSTWNNPELTQLNFNPVLLDGNGGALIWGLGNYQMLVYDSNGAEIWSEPTFCAPPVVYLKDTGVENALVVTFPGMLTNPPAGFNPLSQLDGINLFLIPAYTNSGAATITVEGAGASSGTTVPIVYPGGGQLLGGELVARALIPVAWTGSEMQLLTASSNVGQFVSGMLMPYAGPTVPAGWLLCYGQAVSRSTYAALFTAIGATWGAGDGATTFNVPDLRGRALFGVDAMGGVPADRLTSASLGSGVSATLGVGGGNENAPQGSYTVTVTDPGHVHQETYTNQIGTYGGNLVSGTNTGPAGGIPAAYNTQIAKTGITVTVTDNNVGQSENLPPAAIVNWIIKT